MNSCKLFIGVLYICTEDSFPSKRFTELSEKLPHRFNNSELENRNFKDNVFVEHLDDFVSQKNFY